MDLKCMILNITPYGGKDANGIGTNCFIQYIPLDKNAFKQTNKSKGFYVSYCVVKDTRNQSLFQKFNSDDFLKPCTIHLDKPNLKYASVETITFDK